MVQDHPQKRMYTSIVVDTSRPSSVGDSSGLGESVAHAWGDVCDGA
jgi:hypothetical protein